ncbi:MAG: virulence protein RhuM/Fic/DOC family protein [Fibrobacter sp.]|nr:virulence protein RhuM/Fic/DOC family protein [Fibrobacter sp.]
MSVGYRVKSKRGVLFRQWANKVLKDYLVKGFAINNKVASLKYDELCKLVKLVGRTANTQKKFGGSTLFGHEKDQSFKSSIGQIYQTFDGIDLYPSVEEKAATLLYLVIKNHSFSDGNKRIAATLFLWFMENNRILYNKDNG